MPRQVFSDDLEEKLIALWAEYQTKKSGIMMKRTKKEKEIADKLNLYAKEIGEDMEFSHSIVHNKIDNLKSKAKEHYKKFRRATATGSAVDSTSEDQKPTTCGQISGHGIACSAMCLDLVRWRLFPLYR